MKRAVFILVAVLLVVLSYPSTHPYAGPVKSNLGPNIVETKGGTTGPSASDDDGTGTTADDGDLDGVAGIKKKAAGSGDLVIIANDSRVSLLFGMWWRFIFIR